jgi:hypothetical protein
MGKYRRPRINFVLDEDIRDDLALWAEDEGRTMSNLVERIVTAAVKEWRTQPQPPTASETKVKTQISGNGKGKGKRQQSQTAPTD